MSDPNNPISWVEKAEEDYQVVLIALRRKKPFTYVATFHAQQCAEKYIKALLVQSGTIPPKTHDLGALKVLCLSSGIIIPVDDDPLDVLTEHAILSPYPGDDPTPEEAKEALEIAKAVRKFAKILL